MAVVLLFAQYAWTAHAAEYFVPAPLEPKLASDGNALYNAIPPVVYLHDPNPSRERMRIPAPTKLLKAIESVTATFSITYVANGGSDPWGETCYTFPENAKTAFNAAANIWANILQSSVPITISACWANLGSSSTLGYSGGGPSRRDFPGATFANTWYAGSLANALAGSDLDPGQFDMYLTYNSNFSWYYGTDGNTPSNQHDLMSVVLHEIAHGLNFAGFMSYSSTTGQGSWGYGTGYPNIYDTFMKDASGNQLIDTGVYGNPSTALGNALKSNNIWFHGSNAMAANSSQRVKIYAPSTWSEGSSYSHLDYNTFNNTSNQLMVYAISSGESVHDPGTVTKGILKDLGWNITSDQACTYNISPTSQSFASSGGTGSVSVTASISSCAWTATENLDWVSITSGASGTGNGTVNYSVSANATGATRTGNMTVAGQTFTISQSGISLTIGEAVDNTSLTWTTGGNADWAGQTTVSYYGGDAARSGTITHNQTTWVQTTVTGPATLSFYWKVSSESSFDYLRFYIDGVEQTGSISGSVDWTQKTYTISSGSHTLKWEYTKDISLNNGSDAGWLDKVEFEFTSGAACSGSVVNLQNVTFLSGQIYNCAATTSITAGTGVTVQNGATVTFQAPTINLQSGFSVESGAVFNARQ
ncbi:MAG: BACON domain-containing protein [Nitrospirota bacterium]